MGFEPTTPCLEGRNSTTELHPQILVTRAGRYSGYDGQAPLITPSLLRAFGPVRVCFPRRRVSKKERGTMTKPPPLTSTRHPLEWRVVVFSVGGRLS